MSKRLIDRIPFKKIVVVLASVFGISLGLCGVTAVVASGVRGGADFLVVLGTLELAVMVLSAAGLVIALLVYVTLWIFGGSGEKVSQSAVPSEEPDDRRGDKNE